MKFNAGLTTVVLAALADSALSASVERDISINLGLGGQEQQPTQGEWACGLSQDNLDNLIDGYTLLLTSPNTATFNTTAARILASNFTVHSDSINTLSNQTLGGPSFPPGRDGFLSAQAAIPAIPTLVTNDVYVGGYWNNSYTPGPSSPSSSAASADVQGGNSWWGGNNGEVCSDLRVTWRWVALGVGSGERQVSGIIDLVLVPGVESLGEEKVVIEAVFVEFNTAAWLANFGL